MYNNSDIRRSFSAHLSTNGMLNLYAARNTISIPIQTAKAIRSICLECLQENKMIWGKDNPMSYSQLKNKKPRILIQLNIK